ncbi:hypothetical protein BpHYR1_009394 [Brachionus plicatilis]|uniref:Uncharacterized protein n=1 Tax=Brachionus plicatilis TaxID=10195 RepID=A0A3M7PGL1_BRAPC|nr:hypothetical protein BpHYR1_009394 [Brachionus plicatilis]
MISEENLLNEKNEKIKSLEHRIAKQTAEIQELLLVNEIDQKKSIQIEESIVELSKKNEKLNNSLSEQEIEMEINTELNFEKEILIRVLNEQLILKNNEISNLKIQIAEMEKEIKGSLKNDIPDEEMNDKVGETQILKQRKSNCPDKNCDGNGNFRSNSKSQRTLESCPKANSWRPDNKEGKRECDRNDKSLEDEINKLREKSHSMEQKLIEKENSEMFKKDKAKILDLEETIRKNKSDYENQIDLSRSNNKILTDMNKTLKFENDELKNQVINANLDSNDLTVKLNNQIAAHQNELSDLNRLFDDKRTALKTQKDEIIQNLNRELNYAKKDLEDSKDKAKILYLEETIQQTNCDFENKYDFIKTNNELLNDFNANLKAEKDLLKQRILNSENDLGANQLTLNKLQLELMQVKNDLEDQKVFRGCPTFMPKPTPSYSFESLTIPNQFCQESINKSTQNPTQLSKYFMSLRSHVLNNTMDTGLFGSVNKIPTYKAKICQEDPIIGQFSGFGKYNGLPVYVGSRGGVYINAKTKQYLLDEVKVFQVNYNNN